MGHAVAWSRQHVTSQRVVGLILDEVVGLYFQLTTFFQSCRGHGLTKPLTGMNVGDLPGVRWWPASKGHSLTSICKPIV